MRKPKSKAMRRRNILIQAYVALLSLILVLSLTALLSQTVFATTYVINDGDRVVTYTSFATDPAEVLGQAGVPLEEHDTYTTESPVQIAKKAEKQMRREKMAGAGKQYAPTLYTVLVNEVDDQRLFGYYPTLAGETETYLSAKAAEHGYVMDGQPLVRFIADEGLKSRRSEIDLNVLSTEVRLILIVPRILRSISSLMLASYSTVSRKSSNIEQDCSYV